MVALLEVCWGVLIVPMCGPMYPFFGATLTKDPKFLCANSMGVAPALKNGAYLLIGSLKKWEFTPHGSGGQSVCTGLVPAQDSEGEPVPCLPAGSLAPAALGVLALRLPHCSPQASVSKLFSYKDTRHWI